MKLWRSMGQRLISTLKPLLRATEKRYIDIMSMFLKFEALYLISRFRSTLRKNLYRRVKMHIIKIWEKER